MKRSSWPLIAAAALALAACSGNAGSSGQAASAERSDAPAATATNPTQFPLIEGATILGVKNFSQTVDASKVRTGVAAFSQGSGTYVGEQVIAKSDKSLDDLATWLAAQTKTPPVGYTALSASSAQMDQAHATAKKYGIDFAAFQGVENGKQHGILLIAMDPTVLDERLGPAIGLVEKYATLPDMLKGPVDTELKSRFGMSGSDLLDPGSPLGAALAAYSEVKSTGSRAIVLVDAAKE